MLDFTSALYLGLEHASWNLPGWERLTLGKPAVLREIPEALQAQRELAALTGCERVALGPSTLHLFCDLFALLSRRKVEIWIDEATYPIARWGTDRAAAAGAPVRTFARHDPAALCRELRASARAAPVIITDGYDPLKGAFAPLGDYAAYAHNADGLLVVDDTQALGILGRGGGGSLREFDLRCSRIVVVSSLAKALGAPVAMLGGSEAFVHWFLANSETLVLCSPPSAAAVAAALEALRINRRCGDALRCSLRERVLRFRRGVPELLAVESLFPLQSIRLPRRMDALAVYRALFARGIRAVLHRGVHGDPRIAFVLTTRHSLCEIDRAAASLREALQEGVKGKEKPCHRDPQTIRHSNKIPGVGSS
jgi:8-amino-7-oxononanoate synthase